MLKRMTSVNKSQLVLAFFRISRHCRHASNSSELLPLNIVGKIAGKKSLKVNLEENKTYFWCACGQSSNQPFCDGSHKKFYNGTIQPVKFTVQPSKQYSMCLCKQSKKQPYCDGTHKHPEIQNAVI